MRTAYQIVSDHYSAAACGDLTAMMVDMAPDVQWTEMAGFPCAGMHIGPAQVIQNVFNVLNKEWEHFRFTLESLIDGGDTVVGIGCYHGTYRMTGKTMQARVAHVWQIDAGLIRRFEQFTDTKTVAQAMRQAPDRE